MTVGMGTLALDLRCPRCGAKEAPMERPAWATCSAHGDAVVTAEAPIVPGAAAMLTVRHPFTVAGDGRFRFIALPEPHGDWSEQPETIGPSRLVLSRMRAVLDRSEDRVRIEADIEAAVTLQALATRPAWPVAAPRLGYHQTVHRTRAAGWDLIEASSEGDVGDWLLVRRAPGATVLVAQGAWGAHHDIAWIGPAGLDADGWDAAARASAAPKPVRRP